MDAFVEPTGPQALGVILREYLATVDVHRDRHLVSVAHEPREADADGLLLNTNSSWALETVGV